MHVVYLKRRDRPLYVWTVRERDGLCQLSHQLTSDFMYLLAIARHSTSRPPEHASLSDLSAARHQSSGTHRPLTLFAWTSESDCAYFQNTLDCYNYETALAAIVELMRCCHCCDLYVQSDSSTAAQFFKEERTDDAVYNVYLKKVQYSTGVS